MANHLISRGGLAAAVGMLASGFVILYYISSGFSASAQFQSNTTAIVPNGLLPGFIIGLLLLAFGAVELFASVKL
jgi:sugar phosphate permease